MGLLNRSLLNNLIYGNRNLEDLSVVKSVVSALQMELTPKLLDLEMTELEGILSGRLPKPTANPEDDSALLGEDAFDFDGLEAFDYETGEKKKVKTLYDKIMAAEEIQAGTDSVVKSQRWQAKLSHSEKIKVGLARALIMNPEVMIMHHPLSFFDHFQKKLVLDALREFVDLRGVMKAEDKRTLRRPRTCIFSLQGTEDVVEYANVADVVLHIAAAIMFLHTPTRRCFCYLMIRRCNTMP